MLLLVLELKPSGSSGAFAKLKDPSGSVSGSLHPKALEQHQGITPGAVVLLTQVRVNSMKNRTSLVLGFRDFGFRVDLGGLGFRVGLRF